MPLLQDVWRNMPRDLVGVMLADRNIPIDTRLHFRKEFGMHTHKLEPSPDFIEKLNAVMRKRAPRPDPFGRGIQVFNTSDVHTQFPPGDQLTLIVLYTGQHTSYPRSIQSDITYEIFVKKRKCYVVHNYMLLDSGWDHMQNRYTIANNQG